MIIEYKKEKQRYLYKDVFFFINLEGFFLFFIEEIETPSILFWIIFLSSLSLADLLKASCRMDISVDLSCTEVKNTLTDRLNNFNDPKKGQVSQKNVLSVLQTFFLFLPFFFPFLINFVSVQVH